MNDITLYSLLERIEKLEETVEYLKSVIDKYLLKKDDAINDEYIEKLMNNRSMVQTLIGKELTVVFKFLKVPRYSTISGVDNQKQYLVDFFDGKIQTRPLIRKEIIAIDDNFIDSITKNPQLIAEIKGKKLEAVCRYFSISLNSGTADVRRLAIKNELETLAFHRR